MEILSKTTEKYDLGIKRSVYARTGVKEMWIVDSSQRALAPYRLTENAATPTATYRPGQSFGSVLLWALDDRGLHPVCHLTVHRLRWKK